MALIKCEECGKEISEEARTCPNCGVKTAKTKKQNKTISKVVIMVLIIVTLIAIIGINTNNAKKKDLMYQCSIEAINILESYKEKRIDAKQAVKELKSIKYKLEEHAEEIREENEDKSFKSKYLASIIDGAAISLDSSFKIVDNIEINEFIQEIKDIVK